MAVEVPRVFVLERRVKGEEIEVPLPFRFWRVSVAALSSREPGEARVSNPTFYSQRSFRLSLQSIMNYMRGHRCSEKEKAHIIEKI
jgi:hypothetical protein